jgi:hypothetical protein
MRHLSLLLLLSLMPPQAPAAPALPAPTYQMAAPAPWVEVTEASFPDVIPLEQIVDGIHRIRIERQCDPASGSVYHHQVHRVISEAGIQSGSDLRLTFDPTYEKVILHRLRVQRRGVWEDRLERTPIQVIQREEDLDYHLLDGRLMLVIHLEDIRVDDALEWSWTIVGTNPIMNGQYFDSFVGAGNQPVHDLRLRVRVPTGRNIGFKLHHDAPAPQVVKKPGGEEWIWAWKDNPSWHREPGLPGWYDDKPWVDLSEHPDWASTVRWALPLYQFPAPETPEWNALIQSCRQAGNTEQQILHALRFVQDEIRYLGIEMGAGSHRPNPPPLVLKRRFGDCKDKTVFLTTVLNQLGVPAWPALVNTSARHTIETWLPSPYNFDHVVVALEWEGRLLFLDPTRALQRGPLSQIYITDYALALLIRPGESGLVPLHPTEASLPRTEITEIFQCPSPTQETRFTVTTRYRGASAEEVRNDLAGSSVENLQRDYLEFYANSHALIRLADPLVWKDDPITNTIESTESYLISDLWKPTASGSYEAEFYPQYLRDLLDKPKQARRKGPFAISHPENVTQETRIHLWGPWEIDSKPLIIDSTGFHYARTVTLEDNRKTIIFRENFRTKTDHILPSAVPDYLKACNQFLDKLGHTLEHQASGGMDLEVSLKNKLLTACLLLALLAGAGWSTAAQLSRAALRPPPLPAGNRPPFLPKWNTLMLVGIGLVGITGLILHPAWQVADPSWNDCLDFLRHLALLIPLLPLALLARRRNPWKIPVALFWVGALLVWTLLLLPTLSESGKTGATLPLLQIFLLSAYGFPTLLQRERYPKTGNVIPQPSPARPEP